MSGIMGRTAPRSNKHGRLAAAADVKYLHRLRERLDALLEREGRTELAAACFRFLPTRAELDLLDCADPDIFEN